MPFLIAITVAACDNSGGDHRSHLYLWAAANVEGIQETSPALLTIVADSSAASEGTVESISIIGGPPGIPHHTELHVSSWPTLFASDLSGRAIVFSLADRHRPKALTVLPAVPGLELPHDFARDGDGNAVVTYQGSTSTNAQYGGLARFTGNGAFLGAASLKAEHGPQPYLRPYSLAFLSKGTRILVTGADMLRGDSSKSVQLWSTSPLRVLWTRELPGVNGATENRAPATVQVLPDDHSALIGTYRCGLYLGTRLDTDEPSFMLIHLFPGTECGMGVLVGNVWVQCLTAEHSIAAIRVNAAGKVEPLANLSLDTRLSPHWVAADRNSSRLVITGTGALSKRVVIVELDSRALRLRIDTQFTETLNSELDAQQINDLTGSHRVAFPYVHGATFGP